MTAERDHNPYDLKTHEDHGHEEKPDGYLSDEELKDLLVSKGIPFKRTDNLPRFANNNSIPMMKIKRDGNYGSVPTVYKKPSPDKLEKIKQDLRNVNNSFLGRQTLKEKAAEILKFFDAARDPVPFDKKLEALPKNGDADFDNEVKKKRAAIVKEKWEKCDSKTSIARKVAKSLSCDCNRKYVRKILEKHRSSQLDKKLLKVE